LWKLEKEGKGVNRYCGLKKMEGDQCKRPKRNINWFNLIKFNSEAKTKNLWKHLQLIFVQLKYLYYVYSVYCLFIIVRLQSLPKDVLGKNPTKINIIKVIWVWRTNSERWLDCAQVRKQLKFYSATEHTHAWEWDSVCKSV
jgi:hypothetical protein